VDDEALRLAVYLRLAATGAAPGVAALGELLDEDEDDVVDGLRRLAADRHLVLGADERTVVLAHPFATIPLGFSVMGAHTLWWGGCAWDSFAIPHLVDDEPEVLVATTCPACGAPHAWVVGRDAPPDGAQLAHFLVPVSRIWDDVVHTCGNQRIFCGRACIDPWLASEGHEEGSVLDLATLWRLASRWYEGRLEPGYVRREPEAAREYFATVGLTGDFWGLPG
jgi:hypothetical protein